MPVKGTKMSPEAIAKRMAARKRNAKLKLVKNEPELLPLRFIEPVTDDAEEFGRFLGAAWRAYKAK